MKTRSLFYYISGLLFLFSSICYTQESENINIIGRWAKGPCYAAAVDGSIAYFGNGPSLQIVDFSDPANPIELAKVELQAPLRDVTINGNFVYVAAGNAGLFIFDISDPTQPNEIGSIKRDADFIGVAVQGNYSYVLTRGWMYIIDISDPVNPERESTFYDIREGYSIAISGNYAYVADGNKGLRIINISDPNNPTEVSLLDTGGYSAPAEDVAINGAHAYVSIRGGGVIAVDVSDPANPAQVDSVGVQHTSTGVATDGNHVYLLLAEWSSKNN